MKYLQILKLCFFFFLCCFLFVIIHFQLKSNKTNNYIPTIQYYTCSFLNLIIFTIFCPLCCCYVFVILIVIAKLVVWSNFDTRIWAWFTIACFTCNWALHPLFPTATSRSTICQTTTRNIFQNTFWRWFIIRKNWLTSVICQFPSPIFCIDFTSEPGDMFGTNVVLSFPV